jgi:hypothetical protein
MEEGAGDMAAGPPAAQAQRWVALTVIRTPKSIGTSPRRYHGARTQHPVSQCRSKTWRRPTAQDQGARTRRPPAPSSWPLPAPSSLLTFQTKERNKLTSIQSKRSSIHPAWMYLNPNEDRLSDEHVPVATSRTRTTTRPAAEWFLPGGPISLLYIDEYMYI